MPEKTKSDSFVHRIYIRCFREKKNQIIAVAVLCVILVVLICAVIGGVRTYTTNRSRIVRLRMEDIGELSTQAAYFTNVQVISSSRELFGVMIPFTQSKYVYSYDGVIKAGIDFAKLSFTVDSNAKVITVYLPEAYITSISVDEDSLMIYDESKNIFTPLKLDDVQSSRKQMEAEAREQAIANGLLTEATENAKIIIGAFLLSDQNFVEYEIKWEPLIEEGNS